MSKRIKTCAAVFALALLAGGPAAALELIYPADGTYVPRSNYLIIKGGAQPPLEGMTIEINGIGSDMIDVAGPNYRRAFGDFLIVEPDLDPGENRIVIVGYVKGQSVARAEAKVYFLKAFDAVPPAAYRPFVMHVPEREALCGGCHKMQPTAAELGRVDATTNPCGSCHARRLNRKHVHGPAGVYECTACHDASSSPEKYQATVQGAPLCNGCHDDKADSFRKNKFIHGPVEVGDCQVCHDSHATDYPAQLVMPINELCLSCHEDVVKEVHVLTGFDKGASHPLSGKPDPGKPGSMLSCASCHDPHGGMNKQMFVRGIPDRMLLCKHCHRK